MLDNYSKPPKLQIKTFLIFLGTVVVMLGILIGMTLASKNSWKNGLSQAVNNVLEKTDDAELAQLKAMFYVDIPSNLANSSACFKLAEEKNSKKETGKYAVITRVTTYYGPQAAVFIFDMGSRKTTFVGFAELDGCIAKACGETERDTIIRYWSKKITFLFDEYILPEGETK